MTGLAPGVCLTFDDLFVANWCAVRDLFSDHSAQATFCVTLLHEATEEQVAGLHDLQKAGHEIGYHSRTHPRLKPYLAEHGIDRWIADEIDRGVSEHRAAGFPATSFAAPFHASTPETRHAIGKRFEIARTHGWRGVSEVNFRRRIYRTPARQNKVHTIGSIDMRQHPAGHWDWTERLLDGIAQDGGVGVFAGHDIRADDGPGRYSTPDDLERLLTLIAARGLRTYTLTGFARAVQDMTV